MTRCLESSLSQNESSNKYLKKYRSSRESSREDRFKTIDLVKPRNIVNKIYQPKPVKNLKHDLLSDRISDGKKRKRSRKYSANSSVSNSSSEIDGSIRSTHRARNKPERYIDSSQSSSTEEFEEVNYKYQKSGNKSNMSNSKQLREKVESRLSYPYSDRMEVDSRLSHQKYQRDKHGKIRNESRLSHPSQSASDDNESYTSYAEKRKPLIKQNTERFKTSTPSLDSSNESEQCSVVRLNTKRAKLQQNRNVNEYDNSSDSASNGNCIKIKGNSKTNQHSEIQSKRKPLPISTKTNRSIPNSQKILNSLEPNYARKMKSSLEHISKRHLQNSSQSDTQESDSESLHSASQFRRPKSKRNTILPHKRFIQGTKRPPTSLSLVSDQSTYSQSSKTSTKHSQQLKNNVDKKSSIERYSRKSIEMDEQTSIDNKILYKNAEYSSNPNEVSSVSKQVNVKTLQSIKKAKNNSRNTREESVFSNPRTISRASLVNSEQDFEENSVSEVKKTKYNDSDNRFTYPNKYTSKGTHRQAYKKREISQANVEDGCKSSRNSKEKELKITQCESLQDTSNNNSPLNVIKPEERSRNSSSREGSLKREDASDKQRETPSKCTERYSNLCGNDSERRLSRKENSISSEEKLFKPKDKQNLNKYEEVEKRETEFREEVEEYIPSCNSDIIKYRKEKYEFAKKKFEESKDSNASNSDIEKVKEDTKGKYTVDNTHMKSPSCVVKDQKIDSNDPKKCGENVDGNYGDEKSISSSGDCNLKNQKSSGVSSDKVRVVENTKNSSFNKISSNDDKDEALFVIDNVGDTVNNSKHEMKESELRINKQIEELKMKYQINEPPAAPSQHYYKTQVNRPPYQQHYSPYQQAIQRHLFNQQRPRNRFTKINQTVRPTFGTHIQSRPPIRAPIPTIRGPLKQLRPVGPIIPLRPAVQPAGITPSMRPPLLSVNPPIGSIQGQSHQPPITNQNINPTPIVQSALIPPNEQFVIKSTTIYKSNTINKKKRKKMYFQKMAEAKKQEEGSKRQIDEGAQDTLTQGE